MTLLQQYKQAKDAGNISYGDTSKPVYIIGWPDRVNYVEVGYPVADSVDPATLQATYRTETRKYGIDKLKTEWKAEQQAYIDRLEAELAAAKEDMVLIDEFIADAEPYATPPREEEI